LIGTNEQLVVQGDTQSLQRVADSGLGQVEIIRRRRYPAIDQQLVEDQQKVEIKFT
jgi:hypothetical protein